MVSNETEALFKSRIIQTRGEIISQIKRGVVKMLDIIPKRNNVKGRKLFTSATGRLNAVLNFQRHPGGGRIGSARRVIALVDPSVHL